MAGLRGGALELCADNHITVCIDIQVPQAELWVRRWDEFRNGPAGQVDIAQPRLQSLGVEGFTA